MSQSVAIFAACFCIGGWGIPVHCPSLIFDRWGGWKIRTFAVSSLLAWGISLSYAITYLMRNA